jgi:C-terminal processing protease CtpA/Prc
MFKIARTNMQLLVVASATFSLVAPLSADAQGSQGQPRPIGIGIQVSTDSLLGGNITSIKVTKVVPGSQAQVAGISEGDEIVKIQGVPVVGADARSLKPQMSFTPGESKVLILRKQGGREYEAVLTKNPASKT